MLRSLLACLVVAAMVPCGAALAEPRSGDADVPQPTPVRSAAENLVLTDLAGQRVTLHELRGKVVVLNFWATWCEPCVKEMPLLVEVATRYKDRGMVVVAASLDDDDARPTVEEIAGLLGEAVEVWVGASLVDMEKMQLGSALPATAVIDRNGVIVVTKRGALQPGSLDAALDALLDQKPAQPRLGGAVEAAAPSSPSRPAVQVVKAAPVVASTVTPATDLEEHECDDHEHGVDEHSAEGDDEHAHAGNAKPDGRAASRVPS